MPPDRLALTKVATYKDDTNLIIMFNRRRKDIDGVDSVRLEATFIRTTRKSFEPSDIFRILESKTYNRTMELFPCMPTSVDS